MLTNHDFGFTARPLVSDFQALIINFGSQKRFLFRFCQSCDDVPWAGNRMSSRVVFGLEIASFLPSISY